MTNVNVFYISMWNYQMDLNISHYSLINVFVSSIYLSPESTVKKCGAHELQIHCCSHFG